jgi:hypothetical protein
MDKVLLLNSLVDRQGAMFNICINLLSQPCVKEPSSRWPWQAVAQSKFQTNQSMVPQQLTGRAAALFQQHLLLKFSTITTPSSFQALDSVDPSSLWRKGSSFFRSQRAVVEDRDIVVLPSKGRVEAGSCFTLSERGSLAFGLGSQSSPVSPQTGKLSSRLRASIAIWKRNGVGKTAFS